MRLNVEIWYKTLHTRSSILRRKAPQAVDDGENGVFKVPSKGYFLIIELESRLDRSVFLIANNTIVE